MQTKTKIFIFLLLFLLGNISLWSQIEIDDSEPINPRKGVIYNKETSANFTLHTNGFALGINFGKLSKYYLTKYYQIDIGLLKHPKESRQSFRPNLYSGLVRPYIYGKQNHFLLIRGAMGNKRYLSEKARHRGLAVGVVYQGGITLGLLKPYYLDLRYRSDVGAGPLKSEKYSDENSDIFLDRFSIEGSSGFFKGFDEISIVPGINLKGGVHFAWGAYDQYVKAIEAGIMIDIFSKKVPIMIIEENKPYFINMYITLQLGKRK